MFQKCLFPPLTIKAVQATSLVVDTGIILTEVDVSTPGSLHFQPNLQTFPELRTDINSF